ncbi:MAG: type III pantothenate kinase [Candidatus Omnitrophica bacterium]|nr:type III pantothenate kinase [Candidatus Omnitrophota bacterium]
MFLAIDIGNTNINLGIFQGKRLFKRSFIATKGYNAKRLKNALSGYSIDAAAVCSVVPAVTGVLAADLKRSQGSSIYIIGRDIKVPLKNLYRNPLQVGADRLINAYAGIKLYGAPLIVVDFGTAITLDVISRDKEYIGGMILPGLVISLRALSRETALLPRIELSRPGEFIGRDTRNSMLSGIFYGFAAAVDLLSLKIRKKIGKNTIVVGTGGNIISIARYCKKMNRIDRDLTLKGISLIFRNK